MVRLMIDMMIGNVVIWLSEIGRLVFGFLIMRLMLFDVISSRNRLMLILVLCVMFVGRLCRIYECMLVIEMLVNMRFIRNMVLSVIVGGSFLLSMRLNVVNVVSEIV